MYLRALLLQVWVGDRLIPAPHDAKCEFRREVYVTGLTEQVREAAERGGWEFELVPDLPVVFGKMRYRPIPCDEFVRSERIQVAKK